MKVIMMSYDNEIATLFDSANLMSLYIIENATIIFEKEQNIDKLNNMEKIQLITSLQPDILVCGAISNRDYVFFINSGINVISNTYGKKETIINDILKYINNGKIVINRRRNRFRGGKL